MAPSLSLHQLHSTLTSLQTATHILTGLTHRNKNQHRGTKWWAPFSTLRRSLQKFTVDLEAATQRAEVVTVPISKQRNIPVKGAKTPELDRVVERAVWMRAVFGPRAYEAFTQLTADRQFAQLGLVLIGVLAQVDTAIAPFVPAEEQASPPGDRVETARGTQDTEARGLDVPIKAVVGAGDLVDLGVAISREELDDDILVKPSVEPMSRPVPKLSSVKEHCDPDKTKSKKRKKLRTGDDEPKSASRDVLPEERKGATTSKKLKLNDDALMMREKEPKTMSLVESAKIKKSKKKKKKGADEFDNLFSTLL